MYRKNILWNAELKARIRNGKVKVSPSQCRGLGMMMGAAVELIWLLTGRLKTKERKQ